jgi:hypothetical protein
MKTIIRLCIIACLIFLTKTGITQQLRLGDNPFSIEKSAVLELVSTNQGLLLPRITDTSLINTMSPPNGMIIYYLTSNKLLVRTNGYWQEVVSANNLRLSNLADASINLPANGQILRYNGSAWVNYTAPFLTSVDTSDITNFSQKVRGLFTGSAPISIDVNGQISITQAGTSSDGYLSSTDWNTFNNKQGSGNYLTDPAGNGIVARTALNTTANRTITGTTNRITLTNGDGVSGNPTVDINSSYAGQSSITTLGTVTTGTWNGGIVQSAYGGTGNGFTKFTGPATTEKIFTLPNANATILTDNDVVTIAQGGTGKTTASAALNALLPSQTGNAGDFLTTNGTDASWTTITTTGNDITVLGSDVATTSTTIANVTGLSFNVIAGNTYKFRFFIAYTSAATTTGSRWSINGPAATFLYYFSNYSLTATAMTNNQGLSGYNLPAAANASSAATGSNIAIIEGIIRPSANGTLIARFASEVSGNAITAKTGSLVEYRQIN